jgi:hypothetical protein
MKEFKVFKDILDILKSVWLNIKCFKKLMGKYDILKDWSVNMKLMKSWKINTIHDDNLICLPNGISRT